MTKGRELSRGGGMYADTENVRSINVRIPDQTDSKTRKRSKVKKHNKRDEEQDDEEDQRGRKVLKRKVTTVNKKNRSKRKRLLVGEPIEIVDSSEQEEEEDEVSSVPPVNGTKRIVRKITVDRSSDTTHSNKASSVINKVMLKGLTSDSPSAERRVFKVSDGTCLLYTSPSPRDATLSRMPSSA